MLLYEKRGTRPPPMNRRRVVIIHYTYTFNLATFNLATPARPPPPAFFI